MNAPLFPPVVVNGRTIPSADIAAETQNQSAPKGKPGLAWRKAARALIIRALLLEEAARRGVEARPATLGPGRRETEEEALIRALLDDALEIEPPTEAEIRAVWLKNPERFRAPPLREASHILVAADPRDAESREAARRRAEELTARAFTDPSGFARLAERESDCGSKSSGGALGQLSPGDAVPEFEAALEMLREGEITAAPVATRFGWHVIRLDAAAEGAVLPYAAVRPRIAAAIEKAAWARAAQAFIAALVSDARIEGLGPGAP